MDSITDPAIEQVTVMKSARVGFTKILNHTIGYYIHQDPCSIMVVQPTIDDAEGYSKEEIAPMIRDTPCLAGIVSESKSKETSNTILTKSYPGGTLGLVGANSPRGFRRVSRRVVLFDEVDGYPPSAGPEGDQIKLGIRRTEYFWNRKIVAGSTPTIKDISRIERMFESSDQRRYFVPCPTCGHFQYLKWPNIKWIENDPTTAHYECEKNKCVIPHSEKRRMVEAGEWRATAPGNGKHAGFHIWAAYSFSPNSAWADLVAEFIEAKTDAESLKTFVNTVLGELWEEEYSAKVGADTLQSRAETYTPNVAPENSLILTAGVDVQDNRFEISIYGWGAEEEAWCLAHLELYGDPALPEIWKQLDSILFAEYRHEKYGKIRIFATAIDTGGHFTHETYQWVRARRGKRILAIKGQAQRGKPAIGKPTKQDVDFRGQSLKWGVDLYPVGSDTIKSVIYGRLKHNAPGPGYIHFHAGLTPEFFKQITSEKQVTRYQKGFPIREWIKKPGSRNEALDCLVYAYAALQWIYTRVNRAAIWEQFKRSLEIPARVHAAQNVPTKNPETEPIQEDPLKSHIERRKLSLNRRKKSFVGSF